MSNEGSANLITDIPRVSMDPKRRWILLVGILIAWFSIMGSCTGIGTISPQVLSDIGGMHVFALSTVLASLGMAVMTPVGGKLCDKIGRHNVLLIGASVMFIGSIGLGLSKTPMVFLIFRAIIPFGMGLLQTVPYIVLGEIYEPSKVPKMFSLLAIDLVVSMFLGGMTSGAFYDAGSSFAGLAWPGFIALFGGLIAYFSMPKGNYSAQSEKLDVPGITLIVLFLALFTFVMNGSGFLGGFGNPLIIAGTAAAAVCLILFFIIERKAENPVISFGLFKNKIFLGAFLIYFFLPSYASTLSSYVPLQAAAVLGASATMIGMLTIGRTIITVVFTFFIGVWVSKKFESRAWKAAMAASLIAVLAFLILCTTTPSTSMWILIGAVALTGFTEGFYGSSVMPLAQRQFTGKEMASGTSIIMVASAVSGTAFTNIKAVILNSFWNIKALIPDSLAAVLTPDQITSLQSTHTLTDPAALTSISAAIPPELTGVLQQTVESIKLGLNTAVNITYLFTAICAVVAAAAAITLLRGKSIRKELRE